MVERESLCANHAQGTVLAAEELHILINLNLTS